VTDHDSRVLARRWIRRQAWELGSLPDWAIEWAHAVGFASVTVACEPTAPVAGAGSVDGAASLPGRRIGDVS
jgi:hypothetical protein